MRAAIVLAIVFLVFGASSSAEDIPDEQAEAMLREVLQSHIDGNVPPQSDFDLFLKRDLQAYFSSATQTAPVVTYELLRDGPTQTGIAYPKFYLWVTVQSSPRQEGAVRVAAIDRERFEITHFVGIAELRKDPSQADSIFPPDVAMTIMRRISGSGS